MRVREALGLEHVVPSITRPQAPTMRVAGAASAPRVSVNRARAGSFSSRMKQSCRLSKLLLPRVAQVQVGEQSPDRRSTARANQGLRIWLNQPMTAGQRQARARGW